jgi:hypothetical protein
MKLLSLTLALTLALPTALFAQTAAPAPSNASCKVNTTPPSDADSAFWKGELSKAVALYSDAIAKDPSASLAHVRQIQALLDQQKISEASKLADAWTATSPNDAYAVAAAGSVRLAEGDMVEGYGLLAKAAKLNPCIALIYERMALFEDLAGYHATARKHLALGHQLDPLDDRLRLAWMDSLPVSDQASQLQQYLAVDKHLDEKQRAYLKARLDRRSAVEKSDCHLFSIAASATIPMRDLHLAAGVESYGVEVLFNGSTRMLRLDSTASGLNLTVDGAGGLGLTTLDKLRIANSGNQFDPLAEPVERASSIKIGNVEFANCPVRVFAYAGASGGYDATANSTRISGDLGTDIFAQYAVTLDYIHHEIRLEPLPKRPDSGAPSVRTFDAMGGIVGVEALSEDRFLAPSYQNWTKIYRRGPTLLIPTRVGPTGTKLFRLDSFGLSSIISPHTANEITTTTRDGVSYLGPADPSGEVKPRPAFKTGSFTMDYAGVRRHVLSMPAMDLSYISEKVGVSVSGVIGFPDLDNLAIHIDYRDNLIFVEAPATKK